MGENPKNVKRKKARGKSCHTGQESQKEPNPKTQQILEGKKRRKGKNRRKRQQSKMQQVGGQREHEQSNVHLSENAFFNTRMLNK